MKIFMVCAAISILALAACNSPISVAQRAVSDNLKDPKSAEFKDVHRVDQISTAGTQIELVCGNVNGKNSFGAYDGYKQFAYVLKHDISKKPPPDGAVPVLDEGKGYMSSDQFPNLDIICRPHTRDIDAGIIDYGWIDPCQPDSYPNTIGSHAWVNYQIEKRYPNSCELFAKVKAHTWNPLLTSDAQRKSLEAEMLFGADVNDKAAKILDHLISEETLSSQQSQRS